MCGSNSGSQKPRAWPTSASNAGSPSPRTWVSTNAPVLKRKALDAIDRGSVALAIDLGSSPYVDSTGLGVLVTIGNAARRAGGGLTIERANSDFRTVLELTGIATLFTLSPETL
jgi:anti-sigma B factor antagonist